MSSGEGKVERASGLSGSSESSTICGLWSASQVGRPARCGDETTRSGFNQGERRAAGRAGTKTHPLGAFVAAGAASKYCAPPFFRLSHRHHPRSIASWRAGIEFFDQALLRTNRLWKYNKKRPPFRGPLVSAAGEIGRLVGRGRGRFFLGCLHLGLFFRLGLRAVLGGDFDGAVRVVDQRHVTGV